MEPPKLSNKLSELTPEQLLAQLENGTDEVKLPTEHERVFEFIERFKLQAGPHSIETKLVFKLYLQYYPETMNINKFTNIASQFIPHKSNHFTLSITTKTLVSYLVKKPKKAKKRTIKTPEHLISFFDEKQITPGEYKIPWFALYHVYRQYCGEIGVLKPVSKQTFLTYTKLFFKVVLNNDGSLFLVDKATAHLIEKKDYDKLRKQYKKENSP